MCLIVIRFDLKCVTSLPHVAYSIVCESTLGSANPAVLSPSRLELINNPNPIPNSNPNSNGLSLTLIHTLTLTLTLFSRRK